MLKLTILNKPKELLLKCTSKFPDVVLANLQEKEVTPSKEIQEVVADKPYDGLSKVIVDKIPEEYIVPVGTKEIETNGNYDVREYANASVNVPDKQLGTKTITANGTYLASDDNLDGYSSVSVETSGVDLNDYLTMSLTGSNDKPIASLLIKSPVFDLSSCTSISKLYQGCKNLTTIPMLDTSNITNMSSLFSECYKLKNIPLLNMNNVTNASYMFYWCGELKEIPILNTNKCANMNNMFAYCSSLTEIPELNTSSCTNMGYMFYHCRNLKTIPVLDASKVASVNDMLNACNSLTNFNGLANLGQAYLTTESANYYAYKWYLYYCSNLTHDNLINIMNNLYDIKSKGCNTQTLGLGDTLIAKLTAEEIAIATNKGFSVS